MSTLQQMVPLFLMIEFVLVLVAMVCAMLFADPELSIPTGKTSRRFMAHSKKGFSAKGLKHG